MSKGNMHSIMSQAAVDGNLEDLTSQLKAVKAYSNTLNGTTHWACPLIETIRLINSPQHFECIQLLLNQPLIDVNAYDDTGSCLHLALQNRHPYALEAFKMLLDHPHINVNPVWGPFDITPLHRSIGRKDAPEYLQLLLAHNNINVEMLTKKGYGNVFHLRPDAKQLVMLLQSPKTTHAMITAMDNTRNTPLDIAIKNGRNIDAVELLLPYYLPFFEERVAFLLCNKATKVPLPISVTRLIFSFLNLEQNRTQTVRNVIDFMKKFVPETEKDIEKMQAIMKFLNVYFQ